MKLPPLSLYIHIPWCVKKCPYCDFNSHVGGSSLPEEAYVDALLTDLREETSTIQGRPIESVFIGGGTPSLFSAKSYARLFSGIWQLVQPTPDIEITLEANPGTFEQARFEAYRAIGINRLSLGIQSFDDDKLQALGRVHSGSQARTALAKALQIFASVNVDLMHGLPGQSEQEAIGDIRCALALQPSHISWYQLTLEPNTYFWRHRPQLPEEKVLDCIQRVGHRCLEDAGYQQYEISAYAQAGSRCRHNLNYWLFGDFLGIGAGAHGKISSKEGTIVRNFKTRMPADYLNKEKPFEAGRKILKPEELPVEFTMNTLRLVNGVPLTLFGERTGNSCALLLPGINKARQKHLLCPTEQALIPTPLGMRFLNDLLTCFMADKVL